MSKLDLDLLDLLEAGVHFGHRKDKFHPKMRPYIFTIRDGVCIIDLEQTVMALERALTFLEKLVKENKKILLVGTKKQAQELVENLGKESSMPYVTHRWLGGLLTNFETIRKRLKKLENLKAAKESGELEKYTKKERKVVDEEIERLENNFGGISQMLKLPDAIFIVDIVKESVATKEARALGIPIVALVDTNANPELVDYPIPANDDAVKSIEFILNLVKKALKVDSTKSSQTKKRRNE